MMTVCCHRFLPFDLQPPHSPMDRHYSLSQHLNPLSHDVSCRLARRPFYFDYQLLEIVEGGNVSLLVASGAITAYQGHCIVKTLATNSNDENKNKKKPSCVKTKKDECQTSEEEEEENVDDNSEEEDDNDDENVDDDSDGKADDINEWVQLNQKDTLDVLNLSPQDFKKWLKEGRMTLGPNCSAAS
eukprot:361050_1